MRGYFSPDDGNSLAYTPAQPDEANGCERTHFHLIMRQCRIFVLMRTLSLILVASAFGLVTSCSSGGSDSLKDLPKPELIPAAVATTVTPKAETPEQKGYPDGEPMPPPPPPITEVRYGLADIDEPNKMVVSAMFDDVIFLPTAKLYLASSKSEDKRVISVYSESGKLLTTYTGENIKGVSPYGLIFLENKDGKVGAKTPEGKEVVSFIYDELFQLDKDLLVGKHDKKYYFILDGKELTNVSFDDVVGIQGDYIMVENSNKLGFVDKKGKEVVPIIYQDLHFFSEDLAPAKVGGKWGFVNKSGKEVIPPSYDDVMFFTEGLAFVKREGTWGVINKENEFIISPRWERARPYVKGIAPVRLNGKWGTIDKEGNIVLSLDYEEVRLYPEEEVIFAKKDDKWGLYDWSGKQIVSPRYDNVRGFGGAGLACVRMDKQWGYINTKGEMVIAPRFSDAHPFLPCHDIAVVELKEKGENGEERRITRFIDKEGKFASPELISISTENAMTSIRIELDGHLGSSSESYLRRLGLILESSDTDGYNLPTNQLWWIKAMRSINTTGSAMCVMGFDYVRPTSNPEVITTMNPKGKLALGGSSAK